MSDYIEIAENQSFSSGAFKFTAYPSDMPGLAIDDNANVLPGLDGEGSIQYPYNDFREFQILFNELDKVVDNNGANTLIKELKDRRFKITGTNYYLRLYPALTGEISDVTGNVLTVSGGGMTEDYSGYDVVDANYNAFLITSSNATTLTIELDGGTPITGAFYIVERAKNPLMQSEPLKVRIIDVIENLVPNSLTAIYDYVIKCQKVN